MSRRIRVHLSDGGSQTQQSYERRPVWARALNVSASLTRLLVMPVSDRLRVPSADASAFLLLLSVRRRGKLASGRPFLPARSASTAASTAAVLAASSMDPGTERTRNPFQNPYVCYRRRSYDLLGLMQRLSYRFVNIKVLDSEDFKDLRGDSRDLILQI